jgi:uncharacterized membrane protein
MLLAEELVRIFNLVGGLVCHQRPERTLWVGGRYLPVCARDTGAYIGMVLGYAILLSMRKKEASGPPHLHVTLAMILPLIFDSVGQAFGFWTSTNDLRLMTGLLFGAAIAPLLVYALSLPATKGRIPIIGKVQPRNAILDSKDYWLGAGTLGVGIAVSVVLFFAIRSLDGSQFSLFYWLLSIQIVAAIVWHFFVLPLLLVVGLLRKRSS